MCFTRWYALDVRSYYFLSLAKAIVSISLDSAKYIGGRSPPFIDTDVGASGEPGVQYEDAPESGRPRQTFPQRRVVVQPESPTKPMNRMLPTVAQDTRCHPLAHFVVSTSCHFFLSTPFENWTFLISLFNAMQKFYLRWIIAAKWRDVCTGCFRYRIQIFLIRCRISLSR